MGVDVGISKKAFHCMLDYPYENNIDELLSASPAAARARTWSETPGEIAIYTYHLPDYMLSSLRFDTEREDDRLIHMNSYNKDNSFEQAIQYFQMILDEYQDFKDKKQGFEPMLRGLSAAFKGLL